VVAVGDGDHGYGDVEGFQGFLEGDGLLIGDCGIGVAVGYEDRWEGGAEVGDGGHLRGEGEVVGAA